MQSVPKGGERDPKSDHTSSFFCSPLNNIFPLLKLNLLKKAMVILLIQMFILQFEKCSLKYVVFTKVYYCFECFCDYEVCKCCRFGQTNKIAWGWDYVLILNVGVVTGKIWLCKV